MKRFFLFIYILLLNCTALSAADIDDAKDLGIQAKQFNAQAKEMLKAINPSLSENQAKYAEVGADAKSALQKSYNETLDKVEQLHNKLQDPNANQDDIKKLMDEAKGMMGSLKDDALKNVKDAALNSQFTKELDGKYSALEKKGTEILGQLNNIKDFGFGYNMPVGIEGEFGEVYFHASLDNMVMVRGEEGDMTKAKAVVKVSLPFLPQQEGETNAIIFEGDVFFKKGDGDYKSRIHLKNKTYTVPLIKNKASLVFVSNPGFVNMGNCSLPEEDANGGNYVEFDCNGVTAIHLQGYVDFKDYLVAMEKGKVQDKMPEKIDKYGNIIEQKNTNPEYTAWIEAENKDVRAVFSIDAKGGMVSKLCFSSPFKVKNAKNFVFEVQDAVIDLSSIKNAPDFELPNGYMPMGLSSESWTGFALKQLKCYFPEDFKLSDNAQTARPEATVYDMFIDDYGFTGKAMVDDFFDKTTNAGVRASVKHIAVEFWQNEFVNGEMNGLIEIPFLKKADNADNLTHATTDEDLFNKENDEGNILKFDYAVRISLSEDSKGEPRYGFAGKAVMEGAGQKFRVPFTDLATVTLNPGTGVYIGNDYKKVDKAGTTPQTVAGQSNRTVGRLHIKVVLNGSLDVASAAKANKEATGSSLLGYGCKFEGIAFEGLTFQNVGKKVSIDRLGLKGKLETSFLGLTLTINNIGWSNKTVTKPGMEIAEYGGLFIDGNVQIIPSGSGNICPDFGATLKFYYGAKGGQEKHWHFGGFDVNNIGLVCDIGAIKLNGMLNLYKDDETYGKGFTGKVDLTIDPIDVTAGVQACFGDKDGTKYWFTKAAVGFPGNGIPVFMNAFLKSLTGGVYYHMSAQQENWKESYKPQDNPPFKFADVNNYKPNPNIGLGLIAGMGLVFGSENLANMNAELNIRFTNRFAVDEIRLGGDFSMISPTPKFIEAGKNFVDAATKKMNDIVKASKVCSNVGALLGDEPKEQTGAISGATEGTIRGWAIINYRPQDKFFDLHCNVSANFIDLLTGEATVDMLISPEKWYFRIGNDDYPAHLSFLKGLAKGRTYFMAGELPKANLKPLSPNADKKFKSVSYSQDEMVSNGKAKGMAFAVNTRADLNFDDFPLIFAKFYLEGGCDLLLTDCNNPDSKARWRGQGSIFGDIGVGLGVDFYWVRATVIEGNAFIGLQGGAPTPVQGNAIASFHVKFGRWFDANADLRVHVGKKEKVNCN